MPTYEYRCHACGKLSSLFTKSINSPLEPKCAHCQSRDMARRMSSFSMGKSIQSVHEQHPMSAGESSLDYYSDPRNIGRHVEDSFARQGMEVPQSVRDSIEAAREGEMPKGLDT